MKQFKWIKIYRKQSFLLGFKYEGFIVMEGELLFLCLFDATLREAIEVRQTILRKLGVFRQKVMKIS